ncbi:unnamed protein product [Spirodela intermedia]|uniref:Cytochrome b561 and DOMON domain-containing protein n=1 Tax=Spirodela intermedia TaxID=51605 RepID=A0A7I8KE35_SPIIN|nr:unnamed protein product [Spirodela intermedia]
MLFLRLLAALILMAPPGAEAEAPRCTVFTAVRTYEECTNLPTQQASLAWTYHAQNATVDVVFSGTVISPTGWVAWGINPGSPEMTGTRALVAFTDPATGSAAVLPFVLDSSAKLQLAPLTSRPLDIPLLASSAVFRRTAVEIHATLRLAPNRTTLHHVWNRGSQMEGHSPSIHPLTPADLSSRATVDIAASILTAGPPHRRANLQRAHAVLSALSWGFLLPVGVVVARYLRQYESAGPSWYYAHAAVQLVGFVMGTAGFAVGLHLGRSSSRSAVYGLHGKLGAAAFSTAALQTLALLFRPKTTHRFRRYWKSYHHLVGYTCVVLALVNVFQGFELMGLGRSYAKLGYCLVLSTLLGVCVTLEVNAWFLSQRRTHEGEKTTRTERGIVESSSEG